MKRDAFSNKYCLVLFIARPKDRTTLDFFIQCGKILSGQHSEKGGDLLAGDKGERMEEIMDELGMDEKQLEALHGHSITSTCRRIISSLFPLHLRTNEAFVSISNARYKAIRGNYLLLLAFSTNSLCRLRQICTSSKCQCDNRRSNERCYWQRLCCSQEQSFEASGRPQPTGHREDVTLINRFYLTLIGILCLYK